MPWSPSRAATASRVAFTPSCGVTAAQAVRYSYASLSARDTAFSSPRYDGLSDMLASHGCEARSLPEGSGSVPSAKGANRVRGGRDDRVAVADATEPHPLEQREP